MHLPYVPYISMCNHACSRGQCCDDSASHSDDSVALCWAEGGWHLLQAIAPLLSASAKAHGMEHGQGTSCEKGIGFPPYASMMPIGARARNES